VPDLSPEKFNAWFAGVTLKEFSVWRSFTERHQAELPPSHDLRFGDLAEIRSATETEVEILHTYGCELWEGQEKPIVQLEVTFLVVYGTPSKITDDAFEQMKRKTLRLNTIPFAREFFRDATSRMGFAPVLLPLSVFSPPARSPDTEPSARRGRVKRKAKTP
jgi:hypothetical protein